MNIHGSLIVPHPCLKVHSIFCLSQSGVAEIITVLCFLFQPLPLLLTASAVTYDLLIAVTPSG